MLTFSKIYRTALTHLSAFGGSDYENLTEYSCCAISQAINRLNNPEIEKAADYPAEYVEHPARTFYPLDDVPYCHGFDEFPPGLDRQSARFLWLCLLAEIAESEGN